MFRFYSVFEYFTKGGPVFIFLAAISIISLTLIVERIIAYGSIRKSTRQLVGKVEGFISRTDLPGALLACRESLSPASPVLSSIIERAGKARSLIEEAADRNSERLLDSLNRNLTILATTGSITPFIGLFGTVIGIINAFASISQAETFAPSLVAGGIAEALLNTAAGLFVAIPAVIAYNVFLAASKRIRRRFSNECSTIIETIAGDTK